MKILDEYATFLSQKNFQIDTIKLYQYEVKNLITYITINNIALKDVELCLIKKYILYIKEQGYQLSTINRKIIALKKFLYWGHVTNQITGTVYKEIELLRYYHPTPIYLSLEEYKKLKIYLHAIEKLDTPHRLDAFLVGLLLETGMALKSILTLKLENIHFITKQIQIEDKAYTLPDYLWKILQAYIDKKQGSDVLFSEFNGGKNIYSIHLQQACKRVGKAVKINSIQHSRILHASYIHYIKPATQALLDAQDPYKKLKEQYQQFHPRGKKD